MDGSSEQIPFSWGKRRGIGGAKKDTQFYASFTLDNVKYSLFDCVYLFKTGDPEPYVGKIVKIWEQKETKKVKILWFFLPDEIQKYLGGPVMEKEIFLASGDGPGLADINPLEAIAGKCTVICISKDERNRQPSPRELAMADYIFYRFFDVEKCTLSDLLPDEIAGMKVDFLLNPKDELITSSEANVEGVVVATVPPPQSVVKEDDEILVAAVPLSQSAVKEENENLAAAVSPSQSVVKEDQKPAAAIPVSPAAVKKEHDKPVVAVPRLQSAVKEDEKPTASAPPPRRENIPKHTQNASSGERPPKKLKLSREVTVQNMATAVPDKKPFELTSRQADRSKWFKISWDERLRIADDQGTLVYIQNLDIQFGAADIELICTAKPINHPTYDDPNNGKAYAIFKNKNAADIAISKINSGLVVGGRPLYCSKGLLKVPKPTGTLVGHLSLYSIKIGQKQREEQKKAVSTSHCSQPNTIEYDLALDWMLVREKQEKKFRILHKRHEDDRKSFANMGSKAGKVAN
ncbi:hypothetical protein EJB05_16380 [Eragrostis curvula]|uniref:BAH domain-containing protein n=1 Tax=Eragrostis curvula TaxID=38414 RepID=A0A5J9VGM7_9POAL|nr:hypothetical protein EJB05_16380 [Eragrostis curvula]